MFQELLHFFSFILCAAGLGVTVIGILLAVCAVTTPLIRHKVMAAVPFLSMILGGSLGTYFGWKGINSIPTPKKLEIQAPADSVIRAEVIRNGHVIHQEEI